MRLVIGHLDLTPHLVVLAAFSPCPLVVRTIVFYRHHLPSFQDERVTHNTVLDISTELRFWGR